MNVLLTVLSLFMLLSMFGSKLTCKNKNHDNDSERECLMNSALTSLREVIISLFQQLNVTPLHLRLRITWNKSTEVTENSRTPNTLADNQHTRVG
ncbi:hypothetical protein DFH29DRAFT_160722 [Suillus ampliporus]|nr:hypothetical protein DFH29DRAFT_160722 [Suillus ampliporus]